MCRFRSARTTETQHDAVEVIPGRIASRAEGLGEIICTDSPRTRTCLARYCTRVVCACCSGRCQVRGDGHEEPRRQAGHRTCARPRCPRRQAGRAFSGSGGGPARAGGEDAGGRRERPALRGAALRRGVWSSGGGAFGRGVAPCRSSGCRPDSACVLETSIPPSLSPPARPIPAPVPARPGHERSDPASTCCPWTSVLLAITGFIASNIRGLFGLTGRPPDAEYADDMRRRTFVRTG